MWKFSLADGPTRDQEEETTMEDLLSEQWHRNTWRQTSKNTSLCLKESVYIFT